MTRTILKSEVRFNRKHNVNETWTAEKVEQVISGGRKLTTYYVDGQKVSKVVPVPPETVTFYQICCEGVWQFQYETYEELASRIEAWK
jgi:hypothetical protein